MTVEELKLLCRGYACASEKLHGAPSNVLTYSIDGKNFAYFKTSEPEIWRFSIRVCADRFLELTGIPGVKPARYMGRFHWITIVDVRNFPEAYLVELVASSYRKAFDSLSKTRQREIAGS
jgi:predicted DNA-binding protein (MmcQ/YjbR family)